MQIRVMECKCPICHSDVVKGFKVHDGKQWWSYCISGLDHGMMILDGKEVEWPKEVGAIWFGQDGSIECKMNDSKMFRGRISQQERRIEPKVSANDIKALIK